MRHTEFRIELQAGAGHIVTDTDGEMILRMRCGQVVEHRLGHGGGELEGTQSIAAADPHGRSGKHVAAPFVQRGAYRQVERFADRAGFLGAIQYGDAPHRLRQRLDESLHIQRLEQPDLDQADLFAFCGQMLDQLMHRVTGGAHANHHPLGIGSADITVQAVLAVREFGELVHFRLEQIGKRLVEAVGRLTSLEEDVRILRGAADDGPIRRKGAQAVLCYQIVVDHGAHVVKGQLLDFLDLVGGAETIEKVQEGNARPQRCRLGDQRHVHTFLRVVGGQHGPACAPAGHDVAVITKDRQRVGGHRPCGDMKDGAGQFAGYFEHVGDHEQQALGSSEGGGKRTRLQSAMHCAGRASLSLHFHDFWDGSPDIFLACRALAVGAFPHG